jgi:hypothetical protein
MGHVRVLSRNALRATLDRVDEAEFHRRLDAHMERGDVLMARNTRAFEDLSSFLHEQTLALQGLQCEIRAHTNLIREHTKEMKAEMRAGREALFRMLDRLDGRGDEPGPAPG